MSDQEFSSNRSVCPPPPQERAKIARKSIEDELESLRNHRRDMDIVGGEQKVTEVRLFAISHAMVTCNHKWPFVRVT